MALIFLSYYDENQLIDYLKQRNDEKELSSYQRAQAKDIPETVKCHEQEIQQIIQKNKLCSFEEFVGAIYSNSLDKIKALNYTRRYLSEGLASHTGPRNTDTALHLASMGCSLDIIKYLVDEEVDINASNGRKQTPLHLAIHNSKYETVKFLIKCGADINAKDDTGCAPLHYAARKENPSYALLLLQNGADYNKKTNSMNWRGQEIGGDTPANYADGLTKETILNYPNEDQKGKKIFELEAQNYQQKAINDAHQKEITLLHQQIQSMMEKYNQLQSQINSNTDMSNGCKNNRKNNYGRMY